MWPSQGRRQRNIYSAISGFAAALKTWLSCGYHNLCGRQKDLVWSHRLALRTVEYRQIGSGGTCSASWQKLHRIDLSSTSEHYIGKTEQSLSLAEVKAADSHNKDADREDSLCLTRMAWHR